MDLSAWLCDLGLERYAPAFAANDVDAEVLAKLTAEDLIAIGITSVGHRRRLLEAITALEAAGRAEAAPAGTAPAAAPSRDAERRQLTVLFCDLVGSTELSAGLDPEDMAALIRAYQNAVAGEITRFEGHLAKFMGDGVLAYFGWPAAHEDDAERAVRAGLALVQAVGGRAAAGRPLAARVGIATGLVMVGELIGEGAAKEQTVVGETPNLAARLQALAEPGAVVVSQATRRLVGGLFELTDLGPTRLKGFAEPLSAWRVEGEGRAEGRFEALHGQRLTPLVGREPELAMLMERWARARDGEGQVVLLAGEPGIGKSRLLRALREALAAEPHVALSHFCSPYHTNSALYPIIAQLERAAGIASHDETADRLAKLEALLGQATASLDEAVPLIGALLGIATSDRYAPPNLSPQRQKQRTLEVLIEQLAGLARDRPVLELYEDLQWADPSTLELLGLLVERMRALPVLAVLTYRPELSPPWSGHAHVTSLALNRLGRRQGAALALRITGGKALPAEVLEQILARTDGVPLFVEELTKTVLELGLLTDAGDRYELTGPLPPLAIPATLHDSLMARLDLLAPVKEVAQTGAAIGREFSHELLAAVVPLADKQLQDALAQLVTSELIFCRGVPPEATYSFKHALVQDTAYQSLLKSKRQQLHARIAEAIEERFPDVGETQPEVLARHFTEAGLGERAVAYWRRAGGLAAGRSANLEAIAHLSKGLELVRALPDTPEHLAQELALLLAMGGPSIATKGHPSQEVERTYSRALALCEQLGRSAELFPVLRGLWNHHLVRGELRRAHDLAERLVALAEEQQKPVHRALAHRARGTTLFYLGRFTDAVPAFDEGITIDDGIAGWEDSAHLLLYTERAGIVCRLFSAWTLGFLGFPDRAWESVEAALALAQRLAHANSLAFALHFAALLHNFRREFAAAHRRAEAAIAVANEYGLSQWLANVTLCRGFAMVGLGQQAEGIAQLRAGLAAWNGINAHLLEAQWLGVIAEAHLQAGQFDDARSALDRAAETAAATGESHYQAELCRLRGEILTKTGEDAEAASWFLRTIDTARSQQAKSLELRAATSLARLWANHGKRAAAHDLLTLIYGWFTEGFDTADLKDAKALLDELR